MVFISSCFAGIQWQTIFVTSRFQSLALLFLWQARFNLSLIGDSSADEL